MTYNILLIYPGFPPEYSLGGGISTYVSELAKLLTVYGHNVTVLTRSEKSDGIEYNNNLTIYRISQPKLTDKIGIFKFNNLGFLFYSLKIKYLISKLERLHGNFDVIEVGDWGAEAIAFIQKYNNKILIRCHTPGFIAERYNPLNSPYLSRFVKYAEKLVLSKATNISAPSISLINELKNQIKISGSWTIDPLPLTVNNENQIKTRYTKKFSNSSPLKIVVVGRIEQRKGIDLIINAFNQLSKDRLFIELTFIGPDTPNIDSGMMQQYFSKGICNQYISRIQFIGFQDRSIVLKTLTDYDLLVSAARFESYGYTILEAMSCALPVVGPNIGAVPDMLNHQGEALFEVNQWNSLSEKIRYLYMHPNLMKELGQMNLKNFNSKWSGITFNDKIIKPLLSIARNYK
jgi:glycosyltransferase involved in cell wall biosynthesis